MSLLSVGSCEREKCAVHRGIMLLAGLCAVYNGLSYLERKEPHLASMALFYGALAGLEHHICRTHVRP